MSISALGALCISKPDEAKKAILDALVDSRGDRKIAAEALGTTQRNFYRFIERLRLWDEIDALSDRHNFLVLNGPPRMEVRIEEALLRAKGDLARAARILDTKAENLRARIETLGILDKLNASLRLAGFPKLEKKRKIA